MRYIFVGQNAFGGETIRELLNSGMKPEFVITRPLDHRPNAAYEVTIRENVDIEHATDICLDADLCRRIENARPDVILCCGWGHRVRDPLLSIPRLGWINFHPSHLPAYRGPSPVEWQIIRGEERAGCTAHFMSEKFDAGNIIMQHSVKIDEDDTGETLKWKCGGIMGKLAIDTLELLSRNPSYKGVKQDPKQATYYPYRPDDMPIDWSNSASDIRNMVRALSPFPCAVLNIGGQSVRVAEVAITSQASEPRMIGHITVSADEQIEVASGDYVVRATALRFGSDVIRNYLPRIPEQVLKAI